MLKSIDDLVTFSKSEERHLFDSVAIFFGKSFRFKLMGIFKVLLIPEII